MSPRDSRLLLIAGAVVAAIVLFLVLRPGDDEAASTTGTSVETSPAETQPAATEPSETLAETETVTDTATTPAVTQPEAEPAPTAFTATIAGGSVTGGIQRWSVNEGDRVRIVVRSDVDDELHLHGYDIEKEAGPGRPAIFAFVATLPGRFELEAHHGGGQIAQLDVRP